MNLYIPENSPFLTTDTRKSRWAIPYTFECLNARIDILLGKNEGVVRGKTILDVGSHMGTFAYAAHRMGAGFVHGIDTEANMIEKGLKLFKQEDVPLSGYRLETADVFEFLESAAENSFDTVFCFGMLYYTAEPYRLLKLMRRVARETVLLDTFTAGYAAVQGKDAAVVFPNIKDETLELPLMIVSLTQPEKKDYRIPESFDYRGKDLSMITLPTEALFEIWFQSLDLPFTLLDWSDHTTRPCTFRDLATPAQKKESHWADVYASGIRVAYRLSTAN